MIAILIIFAILIFLSFTDFSDPRFWHPRRPSRRRRFQPSIETQIAGGQNQAESHLKETVPEKQGLVSKVKDSLNLTKHFGFVSDVDSPANQAAIAAVREKEAREGVTEEVPQAPLSERIKEGVNSVAATATEIGASTSGGVHPRSEASPEQAEPFKRDAQPGEIGGPPGIDGSGAADGKQELSSGPAPPRSGQKETDPKPAKEGSSFTKWALHAAHKLGDAVASKDLTDDLPSKQKSNKT